MILISYILFPSKAGMIPGIVKPLHNHILMLSIKLIIGLEEFRTETSNPWVEAI